MSSSDTTIAPFTYDALPGRVVFGAHSAHTQLRPEIERLRAERVLLVVGGHERAPAAELIEPLGHKLAATFDQVRAHVPVALAEAGREQARASQADALLAIGGGSTIGMAKAVALTSGLPVVAIPTTYAGSEMTPVYGITEGNRKTTGRAAVVQPKVVIYDPELTLSLPPSVSGPSAINALAHCVEAFYADRAAPVASLMAQEGIRAIAAGLPQVMADPAGLRGRAGTLYGAYLAGAAFAVAGSGIHHKICHVLGGAYDLPHAETHTIILPHAVALNRDAIPDVMTKIAAALGCADAADGLFDLARQVGAPAALADIGMKASDLGEATRLCLTAVPASNPARVAEGAMRRLLDDAFHGRRPARN